jgi:predicted PurR-regulated permease PerM
MVYAGFTWMTARGEEKKVKEAEGTIKAAVIGIVIVALAYGITSYVLTNVSGVNDNTTQAPAGGTQ